MAKERINTVVNFQAAQEHGVIAHGTRDAGGAPALASAGDLVVPIAATYPLGQVKAAYRQLAERRPFGRVVLHSAS